MCLYVDDILILAPNLDLINDVKKFLFHHFDMKDLGEANQILGMKIIRTSEYISLSQSHYTRSLIDKFGYSKFSSVSTPFDPSIQLLKNTENLLNQAKYSQIIGSLMYFINQTKLDITHVIFKLSRYITNPY